MLRPTYNDLIDSMNKNREEGEPEVQSRYSVVIASAKRARQIISGDAPLLPGEEGKKPLSIAMEEIYQNLVHVEKGLDYEEEPIQRNPEVEDYAHYVLDEDSDEEDEEDIEKEAGKDEEFSDEEDEDDYSDGDYSSDSEE